MSTKSSKPIPKPTALVLRVHCTRSGEIPFSAEAAIDNLIDAARGAVTVGYEPVKVAGDNIYLNVVFTTREPTYTKMMIAGNPDLNRYNLTERA